MSPNEGFISTERYSNLVFEIYKAKLTELQKTKSLTVRVGDFNAHPPPTLTDPINAD